MLSGKLTFVTGAGSGIGRAVCKIFAREGAKVIATDKVEKSVQDTLSLIEGSGHLGFPLDVSKSEEVTTVIQKAIQHYSKPPTVVVNCAGITRDNFILKLEIDKFQEVIDVNLKGTFLVIQTIAKALVEANITNGSIINLASIVGKTGNMGQSNYSASKAAVEALTKTAAKEFGKFGIRCNAVVPGFIKSPMTDAIPDKVKDKFRVNISAGRFGEPEEVAEVIAFLASDKSSYVNGASVDVNGG